MPSKRHDRAQLPTHAGQVGQAQTPHDYVSFTALKATPAGGRVAVRVVTSPSPTIELRQPAGSGPPMWCADLSGTRTSDEPVPHAVAEILRAHGATTAITSDIRGSTDVRIALQFPAA
ncbi:hypothetical protein [Dactylosporangium darangshiense]|uniref:Uncharacterized protein n=1 Tax=Dactylosporangium darangshiense TaxID=579108 RepID=A0ABP8DSP7_9ACTN